MMQRHGLRWRLLLFGAFALLPILGLLGFHAWDETQGRLKLEQVTAANLVTMVAAEQELRFALGRQLLSALALNPLIANPKDLGACNRLLQRSVAVDEYLTGISLFTTTGEPLCSASADKPPPISDRAYFREVLRQKQYIVSDYLITRRNSKAAVALAYPVLDAAGNVEHVLVAGLDLAWLARALAKTPLPPETNLVLVDSSGTVLAPEKWLGKSIADHPVFRRVAGNGGETLFEARGIDGIVRIFIARPLQRTLGGNIYVWVATSKSAIVREAIGEFLGNSLLAFLLAIAFFLVIWRSGSSLVIEPIERLKESARRMGTDLKARTSLPHDTSEIGELAASFDEMAEAIESRETALLASQASLKRANRALRVLSAGNHALVHATDKEALLAEICRVVVSEGGYKLVWIGRAEQDPAQSITILASAGVSPDIPGEIGPTWAATESDGSPAGVCVREHRPVAIPDLRAHAEHSPWSILAVDYGCRRVLCLPVSAEEKVWGVLCLCSEQPEDFNEEEMSLLTEMADDLGFGIETLRLRKKEAAAQEALLHTNERLEARVAERTAELELANRELEAFSYSVSHDLRAPLRSMAGFADALHEDYGRVLDETGRSHLERIRKAAVRMGLMIDELLDFARVARMEVRKSSANLSRLAQDILDELTLACPGRSVKIDIQEGLTASADPVLLRLALQNLLENAWKYTSRRVDAEIVVGAGKMPDGKRTYFVRDNGAGFDMEHAARLFQPFVRLHSSEDFPGTGIGLATVARIIQRHGGQVWAEAEKDKGATFFFTLG